SAARGGSAVTQAALRASLAKGLDISPDEFKSQPLLCAEVFRTRLVEATGSTTCSGGMVFPLLLWGRPLSGLMVGKGRASKRAPILSELRQHFELLAANSDEIDTLL